MGSPAARLALTSFVLFTLCATAVRAAEPTLVSDINPQVEPFEPSSEENPGFGSYTAVNGRMIFLAFFKEGAPWLYQFQCGLWVTDGTAGGTRQLLDICGETESFSDYRAAILGSTGSVAFFTDFAGRLWRTDGTAGGTFPLGDITVDRSAYYENPEVFSPDRRTFYFRGCTRAAGCEPWRSDGTREGTVIIRDLKRGKEGSNPALLVLHDGRLLFAAGSDFNHRTLWSTDGTADGTVPLFSSSSSSATISRILPVGTTVYFTVTVFDNTTTTADLWVLPAGTREARKLASFPAYYKAGVALFEAAGRVLLIPFEDNFSQGLWTTDGTAAGTHPLLPSSLAGLGVNNFAGLGSRVLFAASRAGSTDGELWFIDPPMRRARRLAGCPGGCPRFTGFEPFVGFESFVPFRGRLFFAGWDPAHGNELWSTDGTSEGTHLVIDRCPGTCDGAPRGLKPALNRLFFAEDNGDLWVTDGTAAGTFRFARVPYPSATVDLAELDGEIFFTGFDDANGVQPWRSDLTPAGTEPIGTPGGNLAAGSRIMDIARAGDRSVFAACDGTEAAIWTSDGTPAGTLPLPGTAKPCELFPSAYFKRVGGLTFFSWKDQLWRTDGTAAGTTALLDLTPFNFPAVIDAAPLQGRLFFAISRPTSPQAPVLEFWTSDGTPQGTQRLFERSLFGVSDRLSAVEGAALFSAQNADPPYALNIWFTDGTEAGTWPILQGSAGSGFIQLARAGGRIFFFATGADRQQLGPELWVTDGTAAGTAPVLANPRGPRPRNPLSLVAFQGAVYFFAETGDPAQPRGLWRSDGTASGTRLLKAIDPPHSDTSGDNYLEPQLTPVGGQLFFRANDGVHGTELWKTDGTAAGTAMVRDIAPGPRHSHLDDLTAAGGKLYFGANDGEHGYELWQSDGTAAGTRLAADVVFGPAPSNPEQLLATEGKLFFTADDGEHGREPWVLPLR